MGEDALEDVEVLDGGTKMRSIVDWRTRFAERGGQYSISGLEVLCSMYESFVKTSHTELIPTS